jgi:hypothetical protein
MEPTLAWIDKFTKVHPLKARWLNRLLQKTAAGRFWRLRIFAQRCLRILVNGGAARVTDESCVPAEVGAPAYTTRILVADDHERWRLQVRHILKVRPEWSVASEACDDAQAIEKANCVRRRFGSRAFAGNRIRPMLPNHRQQIGRGTKRRTSMDGRTLPGLGDN